MQNKANFRNDKMNANFYLTKDYERNDIFAVPESKANSNPIKANSLDAQMNVSSILTKDYENKRLCRRGENKPNQTQFQTGPNSSAATGHALGRMDFLID